MILNGSEGICKCFDIVKVITDARVALQASHLLHHYRELINAWNEGHETIEVECDSAKGTAISLENKMQLLTACILQLPADGISSPKWLKVILLEL